MRCGTCTFTWDPDQANATDVCPNCGAPLVPLVSRRHFMIKSVRTSVLAAAAITVAPALLADSCATTVTNPLPVEFTWVDLALVGRQHIPGVGRARTADAQGPSLLHFQTFWDDPSAVSSMEMHADGTIYVAYTPPAGPLWYESDLANESSEHSGDVIPVGSNTAKPFKEIKASNVDEHTWLPPSQAFRLNRRPAPRWYKVQVPLNTLPADYPNSVIQQIPAVADDHLLNEAGAYSGWDIASNNKLNSDFPEWVPILPAREVDLGTVFGTLVPKKYFPDLPVGAVGPDGTINHILSWVEMVRMAQQQPSKLQDILRDRTIGAWKGRIPWISSSVEGVVPNSFLSGDDYPGDHASPPFTLNPPSITYWLGDPPPAFATGTGTLHVNNGLQDDWIIYLRPEPEYRFMLASSADATTLAKDNVSECNPSDSSYDKVNCGTGNSNPEHMGSLENEIEQWLVPGGFRPDAGDRVYMVGRWVIDSGHYDWHAELHPYECFVASHIDDQGRSVNTVVITGAWQGQTLDLDLWTPPRPSATATLRWHTNPVSATPSPDGIILGCTIQPEVALPADNPNHIHVTITLAPGQDTQPLDSGGRGDVYYDTTRRLAARWMLWWELHGPTRVTPPTVQTPPVNK
jgi:hypothetical protein